MRDQLKNEPITINIDNSLDASGNFEVNNLLQRKAIDKIQGLIGNRLKKVATCDHQDCSDNRKHDTITILGERGSGKTSLLLNLKTILNKHESDLVFLKIIDPTLFETKQNILVSIIALIADKIKDKEKDTDNSWNESLIKLADGLKLLDGVGSDIMKSDLFDDGVMILEKGLDHAHSGLNLEKYFNCYLAKSLSLLNKKMFILIFDDIDTNIDKGWMVLETIRKYLTSCQLQVFVSGDWGLYSSLVRMKQWENFDKKALPEKEWHNKEGLIDQLEEQYLIKVLKPEYRIYLENLYQLTKQSEEIFVEGYDTDKYAVEQIYKYVGQILFNFQNESQKQEVADLIKQLPIRTNMKIFYAHLENRNNVEELINAISNVFITNTARFGFTHLDYENLAPNVVIQEMAKKLYLISNKTFSFEKLNQFPMNLSDKDLNLLLMVVNLHLTKTLNENKHIFFEWLTRFTYLNILGNNLQEKDEKNSLLSGLKYNSAISMAEQIYLLSEENNSQTNKKKMLPGFRATYAFSRYARKHGYIGIDTFQESGNLDENFLLNILLSKSGQVAHSEQSNISIINIFAFLYEFLQKSHKEAETYLISIFEEFHYFKGDDHLFTDQKIDDIISNSLYKTLLEWHKLKDKNIQMFSIFQISRIWENFINNHDSILQNRKFLSLKDFITAQITVFFNLMLTELSFNKGDTKPYGSVLSPTFLNRNLQKIFGKDYDKNFYNNYEELDFFKYMYLCPIMYCFLQDSKFVIPEKDYWIGEEHINRIHNSFGELGIINTENQKEEGMAYDEKADEKVVNPAIALKINYLNLSDLKKLRRMEKAEDLEIIEDAISQIKRGEIKNRGQLWDKIKVSNTRITSEREAILDRFISNVQNDIVDDTSAN